MVLRGYMGHFRLSLERWLDPVLLFFLSYREHFWNNGIFDDIFYRVFSLSFSYVGECHFSLVIYVSGCLIFTLNVSEKIYTYITYVHIILVYLYLDVYYIQ